MSEPLDVLSVEEQRVEPNPRLALLIRKSEPEDALEAKEQPQRKALRLGLGFVGTGVLFSAAGFILDPYWYLAALGVFLYPAFGAGFFLLAQQEIGRLKREVAGMEEELKLLVDGKASEEAAESGGDHGPVQFSPRSGCRGETHETPEAVRSLL